ncbi:hypothetical protein [Vreelandella aquamarina]|uniref:Uncharacterized protein n=1 Tax=Vreelandella aquamarina TaxID=77097 RepID=A0A1H8Q5H0_9GAMM|nr:hypothetical protein [Halomonas aquamarina]SEO49268.1 hypothetical protein SAMN04490369_11141 [Halomonas aquamarina]
MSHSHATSPLAAPIRALLTQAPASALPMTYQQVANTLARISHEEGSMRKEEAA